MATFTLTFDQQLLLMTDEQLATAHRGIEDTGLLHLINVEIRARKIFAIIKSTRN